MVVSKPTPEEIRKALDFLDQQDDWIRRMWASMPGSGVQFYNSDAGDRYHVFDCEIRPKERTWPLLGVDLGYEPMVKTIEQQLREHLAVDAELLKNNREGSAHVMTITMKALEESTKFYLDSLTGMAHSMVSAWIVEDYVLVYLRGQPHIILCGSSTFGTYTEDLPKRFRSARAARVWAKSQIGRMQVDMTLQPIIPFVWTTIEAIEFDESTPLHREL